MSQESILVVDDEEVIRDPLRQVLEGAGYSVSVAENGPEGLELARRGSFAAAIVDIMIKRHIRRLPVVSDGQVVGIVYISDLFYHLLQRYLVD